MAEVAASEDVETVAPITSDTPETEQPAVKEQPKSNKRPRKPREASKNNSSKQTNGANAEEEAEPKEEEPKEDEDAAPKRPPEKPYRNPERHLTGGTQRDKLTPEELAERMGRIRLNNEKIKERRATVEADMQAFQASQAAQREKDTRQRKIQAGVNASRAENARRKMAKVGGREWDFDKEGARKGASAAPQDGAQDDVEAMKAWGVTTDESAWGVASDASAAPAAHTGTSVGEDSPRGRGKGRGRGRGKGERGGGGGRGRGRNRAPVEYADNSWAQADTDGAAADDAWGISGTTGEESKPAAAEDNPWMASATDESAWGIAS